MDEQASKLDVPSNGRYERKLYNLAGAMTLGMPEFRNNSHVTANMRQHLTVKAT